jgi:hypothetical protein
MHWSRALAVVAGLALAGCGGAAVTESPSTPSNAPGSPGSSDVPAESITITRTGGIAGMHDVVVIAPDNSPQLTQRDGVVRTCTPSQAAIDQIRATNLAALGPPPSKIPIMDGFGYEVVTSSGRASVGDGDSGAHGELLSAASEVVSSCLANVSPPSA